MKNLETLKECLRMEIKKKQLQELQRQQDQVMQEQRKKIQQKKRFDDFVNKM